MDSHTKRKVRRGWGIGVFLGFGLLSSLGGAVFVGNNQVSIARSQARSQESRDASQALEVFKTASNESDRFKALSRLTQVLNKVQSRDLPLSQLQSKALSRSLSRSRDLLHALLQDQSKSLRLSQDLSKLQLELLTRLLGLPEVVIVYESSPKLPQEQSKTLMLAQDLSMLLELSQEQSKTLMSQQPSRILLISRDLSKSLISRDLSKSLISQEQSNFLISQTQSKTLWLSQGRLEALWLSQDLSKSQLERLIQVWSGTAAGKSVHLSRDLLQLQLNSLRLSQALSKSLSSQPLMLGIDGDRKLPKLLKQSQELEISLIETMSLMLKAEYQQELLSGSELQQSLNEAEKFTQNSILLGGLAFSSLICLLLLLRLRTQIAMPLFGQLACFLPEECVAELGVYRQRLQAQQRSEMLIRLLFTYCVLELFWTFYFQVPIDNLSLPRNKRIDD
jgi:hypothetical protein